MNKELAQYINTLLAERERELNKEDLSYKECLKQKNLNPKAEFNSENSLLGVKNCHGKKP